MKEKDIKIDSTKQPLILYAEKEDESIGPVLTSSYMAEKHLVDFHEIWGKLEKDLLGKLIRMEISPIARFKQLEEMSLKELASRTGIPARRVKKHLQMKHFMKATVDELARYADVFNIPVANLFQIIETKQDASWNIGYIKELAMAKALTISQESTTNPLLVITNPEKTKS